MTGVMNYFEAIWQKRYFWLSLVKIDLRRRYRRSWLGIGWSLMHPIAMTAVFCVVFCKLFGQEITTYAPYVLSGLAFWNFFTGVAVEGCQSFIQGECYIRQHPAPLAIYPLRTVLGLLIHFGMALGVLITLVWISQGFGNLRTLWSVVPAVVTVAAFGWSLAVCVGALNVLFQDTQHLVQVGMQVLFYITPVFYPPELLRSHGLAWVVDYNPLAACLQLIRQPIVGAQLPSWEAFGLAGLATLITACIATFTLMRLERRLIFYL